MSESENQITATELRSQWKDAIAERDKLISDRKDNMFKGPMGIEEHLSVLQNDARMNAWFLNKLIELVAANEK